jgi:hypothetical protein
MLRSIKPKVFLLCVIIFRLTIDFYCYIAINQHCSFLVILRAMNPRISLLLSIFSMLYSQKSIVQFPCYIVRNQFYSFHVILSEINCTVSMLYCQKSILQFPCYIARNQPTIISVISSTFGSVTKVVWQPKRTSSSSVTSSHPSWSPLTYTKNSVLCIVPFPEICHNIL